MTDQHPITPPPELVAQWALGRRYSWNYIATQAARWGADQELDACCEWLDEVGPAEIRLYGNDLRIDRRPKPKSLAEEALEALKTEDDAWPVKSSEKGKRFDIIRRALERLQELEGQVMTDTTNTVLTTSSENRGVVPARVESGIPKAYRLIMDGDGNGNTLPALQGLFTWTKGSNHGAEWRTLETQECPFLDDSIPFGPIGAGGAG